MDVHECRERLNFIHEGNLNEESPVWDERVPGIKIGLKEHQRTMLRAMDDLENGGVDIDNNLTVYSTIGICADAVGAGKSLSVLAMISHRPVHLPRERIVSQFGSFAYVKSTRSNTEMMLESNLIIAPHSCVTQWVGYITEFTTLPLTIVSKRKHIDTFSPIDHKHQKGIVLCSSSMFNEFCQQYHRYSWSRAVFDEADTISIPAMARPSANFVWFITSSLQNLMFPSGTYFVQCKLPNSERMMVTRKYIEGIRRNGFVKDTFRTIEARGARSIIQTIFLKNNDNFVAQSFNLPTPEYNIVTCRTPPYMRVLLGLVNDDIIALLNAGDVGGAIERIGCKIESHENIIDSVTQSYKGTLHNTERELQYTRELSYTREQDLETQRRRIATLEASIANITHKITSIESRMKSFQDTACPICFDTRVQPTVVPCCQQLFCFECITRSMEHKNTCPMCRSGINETSITVIGDNIRPLPSDSLPDKDAALQTIFETHKDGKFLVFSSHDQSFVFIEDVLKRTGHEFIKLMGSIGRVNALLKRYKSGDINVLMLNASHYGTGLNLENTTDLVFYHRMPHDMERQVIGRAQRSGRTERLRIHYLYQENELSTNSTITSQSA